MNRVSILHGLPVGATTALADLLVSSPSQQDEGPSPSTARPTQGEGARLGLSGRPARPGALCDE